MNKRFRLIAEFCQNHNGDFTILRQMVQEAAEGGATHAKIQSIFADDLSYRPEFEEGATDGDGRMLTIRRPYQAEYDRLKNLELTYEQHRLFVAECRSAGMEPLTTAFTLTCVPAIRELGWNAVKVASYDCGSLPLLELLVANFSEIIVSTGASYDEEVTSAASFLGKSGRQFSLLHCVTLYPTPLDMMNLARLDWLKELSPSVGLSDHSLVSRDGIKSSLAAIHLGADTIERHFTVLPEDQTRDGRVSIRRSHLRELRAFADLSVSEQREYLSERVPEFDAMLGSAQRTLSHDELLNRAYYRGRFCNKVGKRQIFNWQDEARGLIDHAGQR